MRHVAVAALLWTLCFLAFPCLGQQKEGEEAKKGLAELEKKVSSSEEKLLSLKKDIADLSRQMDRLVKEMSAMQALLDEALTEEARQAMTERVKAGVLSFISEVEGERDQGNLGRLYWRYPKTIWSDDALWALAIEFNADGKEVEEAADVWRHLVEKHETIHLQQETVQGLGLTSLTQRRAAFKEAGGTEQQADRVTALLELAKGLIQLGDLTEAKQFAKTALSICPAEAPEAAAEIKAVLRQVDRMSP